MDRKKNQNLKLNSINEGRECDRKGINHWVSSGQNRGKSSL